jgi:CDP-glycerol glycerophosphotransferase (TagB/SpsB family)
MSNYRHPDWWAGARLLVGCLVNAAVARLTRLMGRDERCWLFGARLGSGFVDNARYLFEYADGRPEVRAVWLSSDPETVRRVRERGYEAYHARSWRGRWLALRAGRVLVTHGLRDVSLPWTGGAQVTNLWHGVPLKTVGFDAELADRPWPVRRAHRYVAARYDLVVSPSPMAVHGLATGLGVDRERIRVLPYPRFDPLVAPETAPADPAAERLAARADGRSLVWYLPTFRAEGADLGDRVDFVALDDALDALDARLVVGAHPFERLTLPPDLDNVTELGDVADVSSVLRAVDVLVTDYSSVFVDFLALDRPTVFFAPDLDRYRADRGFYFDYEGLVPGPVVRDEADLPDALARALTEDPAAVRRRALRESFLVTGDGRPSARVFEALRATRPDGPSR